MTRRERKTRTIPAMAPAMARRYAAMRQGADDRFRRIAALSGVLGAVGQANSGAVDLDDLDDIACVATMIRDGAHDILEALDDFAAPADM